MRKRESFFQTPGAASLRQAVDWVAFAGTFAILFNALHPSGIEIKVGAKSEKQSARKAPASDGPATYSGWANPSDKPSKTQVAPVAEPSTQAQWEARFPHLSIIGAKKAWDTPDTVFLDARKPEDYAEGHIQGAVNFYAEEFDQEAREMLSQLTPDKTYIIYCNGTNCDLSHHLALKLSEQGYNRVKVFFNGWSQWKKAGYPTQQGAKP